MMTDLDIIKECRQTGRTRTTTKNLLEKAYYKQMTEPKFPKIHIANSIKIEETEYVSDELVPILQFNISVSKETFQDHKVFWLQYFKEYNECKGRENPTPEVEVKKQIITALVDNFNSYLWKKIFNYD